MEPDPCVRYLFAGSGFLVGEFRCPPGAERWRTENWIGRQVHVVVPGTPVVIVPAGADPHLSTANEVLVYDADVHYRRRLASREGDLCRFLILDEELAAELGLVSTRSGPRLRHCPLTPNGYAAHRLLAAMAGGDGLAVDEFALALLGETARRVTAHGRAVRATRGGERARSAAVEAVKQLVATRLADPLRLADLAAAVHYSPYWLARTFRRHTGYSIHAFRQQLRLRASLDRLMDAGADLSEVAAGCGFSSHSHYTYAFRRAFGCPPSEVRRAADARDVRRLRAVVQLDST